MAAGGDATDPAAVVGYDVAERLAHLGLGTVERADPLEGGIISRTFRLRTSCGDSVVLKTRQDAPELMYRSEAMGLDALRIPTGIAVPLVLFVRRDCLVLEDLGEQPDCDSMPRGVGDAYWETFGRGMAHLHGRLVSRFGFAHDTHWGMQRMDNRWQEDGYRFYAEQRYLWQLRQPGCARHLDSGDRRMVERIAARLRVIVPPQPPCLNHGDLWAGNRAVTRDLRPAMIDPFVHYGWAEADLHNCRIYGGFPPRFFDAYLESHPLEPGWRERSEVFDILHLMGMVEHGWLDVMPWLRRLLLRFS